MFEAGGIDDACISVFEQFMLNAPSPNSTLLLTHLGGAMSNVADNSTAYAFRKAVYSYQVKAIWDSEDQRQANMDWVSALGAAVQPFLYGAYVNCTS